MARIAGVDLPNEKRVEIGLTYIFGIGLTTSKKILADTGIDGVALVSAVFAAEDIENECRLLRKLSEALVNV